MKDFSAGGNTKENLLQGAGMRSYDWARAAKHFKRVALFLLAIFLTFAPPGTLIFGAILLSWLIGNVWVTVAVVLSVALMAVLLTRKRIRVRNEKFPDQ